VTTVLLAAAVGLTIMVTRLTEPPPSVVRAFVPPPAQTSFVPYGDLAGPAVISPDGKTLAFTAMGSDDTRSIWVRPLEVTEARELPGTDDATFPFWSGDSRSIGFFADGLLKRTELAGGAPITVCEALNGRGGTWNADSDILFAPDFSTPIHRVPATGGKPVSVTTVDSARHTSHRWPSFLPDGRHFLYSAIHTDSSRSEENAIFLGSLDGGGPREVMRSSVNAECTGDHLLYVQQGTLMAAPFDARTGLLEGVPRALADAVAYNLATWKAAFSSSPSGVIAYNPGGLTEGEGTKITTYDRGGRELKVVSQVTSGSTLRVSPDGGRFAFTTGRAASSMDVWVYDAARDLARRVTFLAGFEGSVVWSPDGTELLFSYDFETGGDATAGIYRIPASGGPPTLVVPLDDVTPESVSPDGRHLLFSRLDGELWVLPLQPPGDAVPLFQTPSVIKAPTYGFGPSPRFSPDGRWITYVSDESGVEEVYVVAIDLPSVAGGAPRVQGKWQISNGGAVLPRWSTDGSELYFLTLDSVLMAVDVNVDGSRLDPGPVEPLFEMHVGMGNNYDVTPDGRFVATSVDETTNDPVALILNWTSGLEP
jgi:Tol biopolymer transport system component